MAAIIRANYGNSHDGHICGATIIAPKHALTAAHCVDQTSVKGGSDPLTLEAWRHDLSIPASQESPHSARNDVIAVHRYHPTSWLHDVAVLELEYEYPSEVYSMVVLNQDSSLENQDDRRVTCSGWGGTNQQGTQYPDKLQTVGLNILNSNTCSQLHQDASGYGVYSWEFCARKVNKDSCFGDSGGPLYETYTSGGTTYYQINGIVSWGGAECAAWDEPGVYASVADHYDFIQSKLPVPPTPVPTADACTSKGSGWWATKCPEKCGDPDDCHSKCGERCTADCLCNAPSPTPAPAPTASCYAKPSSSWNDNKCLKKCTGNGNGGGNCHNKCNQKCSSGCLCDAATCSAKKPNSNWGQQGMCPNKCDGNGPCHSKCNKKCTSDCSCNSRRLLANANATYLLV
jgi:hypothetical protein